MRGFFRKCSNNVFALIDSERLAAAAPLDAVREAFKQTCQSVGIECHVLERRATENYLTDAAIKTVKGNRYRMLGPYQELKKAALPWAKSENWRIAREMSFDDIKDTDLGKFLASL